MATEVPRPYQPGGIDFQIEAPEGKERGAVLACTKEAASGVDYVYEVQRRTSLYPPNVSDEAVDRAAGVNPDIYSHYTVVRLEGGQLVTIPYHKVFKEGLLRPIHWVEQASEITRNSKFRDYLRLVVRELRDGPQFHEKAVEAWLSMAEPEIDCVLGAIDRYPDRRKKKFFYQGWTGGIHTQYTEFLQRFIDGQLAVWRDLAPSYAPKNPKVKARADNTERFGGLARVMRPSANNLPCEQDLRERYGSKIIFFLPSLMDRLVNERLPFLRRTIRYEDRRGWTEEELREAGMLVIAIHEPGHSLIRRPNDEQRLGSMFAYLNEMYSTVLGLAILGRRKDVPDRVKDMILALQFATIAAAYEQRDDQSRKDYLDGFATLFNTLLEKGEIAIDNQGYIRWDNTDEILSSLSTSVDAFEALSSQGSKDIVANLRRRGAHLDNLRLLAPFRAKQNNSTQFEVSAGIN